jgi:hypothetical protein
MRKANAKNGTPTSDQHLCLRCSWGQCMTGYRESDRRVICTNSQPNMLVPFPVQDCTSFHDKHRPDWRRMNKLAIDVQPLRISSRTTGFSVAADTRPLGMPNDDEDEEEDEAALVRWIITNFSEQNPAGDPGRGYIW